MRVCVYISQNIINIYNKLSLLFKIFNKILFSYRIFIVNIKVNLFALKQTKGNLIYGDLLKIMFLKMIYIN